jgi:hypothetical protein
MDSMVVEDDDDSTGGVPKGAYVPMPIFGWLFRRLRMRKKSEAGQEKPDVQEDA